MSKFLQLKGKHMEYCSNHEMWSCDMDYIGYTTRHLHQRIEEHKSISSSVGRHMKTKHDLDKPELKAHFTILKKCKSNLTVSSRDAFDT